MLKNGDPTRDLQQSRSKNTYLNGNEEENDGGSKIRSSSCQLVCLIFLFLFSFTATHVTVF